MKVFLPTDVSMQMRHVDSCHCGYAMRLVNGFTPSDDVKVIDARCIYAYIVPDDVPADPPAAPRLIAPFIDHRFRSLDGGARCVAEVGMLGWAQPCGFSARAHRS